jgi:hypothetical protein
MLSCDEFTDVSEEGTATIFKFAFHKTGQIFLWGVTSFKTAVIGTLKSGN